MGTYATAILRTLRIKYKAFWLTELQPAFGPPVRRDRGLVTGIRWRHSAARGVASRISQTGAVVKSSRGPELAQRFMAFLTGKEGRAVLPQFGFDLPD